MDLTAPPEHLAAFIDIGTNSVRLLIAKILPTRTFNIVYEQKETVRLGEGEFRHRLLQEAAMKRAGLVLKRFAEVARARGCEQVIAVATSATREAENKQVFLRYLQRKANLAVRVISGKEEARLIYLGVSSGLSLGSRKALFIDIGGGSTEVIVGDQQQHEFLDSIPLGAIRVASQFFRSEDTGVVSAAKYARMQREIRTSIVRTLQTLRQHQYEFAVGSSGTIMNLAEVIVRKFEKRSLNRDETVSRAQVREAVQMLCGMTLEERRKVPGLNPERADIIISGSAILETLMDELRLPEIQISDRGLRDGLPVDYIQTWVPSTCDSSAGEPGLAVTSSTDKDNPSAMESSAANGSSAEMGPLGAGSPASETSIQAGSIAPAQVESRTLRERSVLELGRRCGFEESHARQIVRLAGQLFDSGQKIGLHKLGTWERELLEHAAMLHDVGTFVSYNHHRQHSAYLILNADLLGFHQTELSIIANVVLYHHKAMPRAKDPAFAAFDKPTRQTVRQLCLFLRLAESLDRSHLNAVREARFDWEQGERGSKGFPAAAILEIIPAGDCHLEIWELAKHEAAFEAVFDRPLHVTLRRPQQTT